MGGYGTQIGETKSYKVYLYVNCSSENNKFVFKVEIKSDNVDIDYSDWCSEEDKPDMEKFAKELNEDYIIYWIKDKGLRNKAQFERRYQELEKENLKHKEHIASLKEKIDNIKKIL